MFTLPTFLYNAIIAAGDDPAVWPPLGGFSNDNITFNSPLAGRSIDEFEVTSFIDTAVGEPNNNMATTVQTSELAITSATSASVDLGVLRSTISTTVGKSSINLATPTSSEVSVTSIPTTSLSVLDNNTSSATAISMDKSELNVTSDQSNSLAVTSDTSVQLEVDSDKSTKIGSDDQRTKLST